MDSKVTVTMDVKAGQAAQEMQQLTGATKNLALEQQKLQQASGSRGSLGSGTGDGLLGAGLRMAAIQVGVHEMTKTVNAFTLSARVFNDSLTGPDVQLRRLAEAMPLVGGLAGALLDLSRELNGTAEAVRVMGHVLEMYRIRARQAATEVQAEQSERARLANLRIDASGTRGAAFAALRMAPGWEADLSDRSSVAAIRRGELAARTMPFEIARERARASLAETEKELTAATAERKRFAAGAEAAIGRMRGGGRALGRAVDMPGMVALLGMLPGGALNAANPFAWGGALWAGAGKAREMAGHRAMDTIGRASADSAREEAGFKASAARSEELMTKAAAERSAIRKAEIGMDRERLALLKEEEGRVRGRAVAFGGSDVGNNMFALHAAQRFKKVGPRGITPEEEGILRAKGYGEYIDLAREKTGAADPHRMAIDKIFGAESDLAKLHKEIAKASVGVEVKVAFDEALLKKELRDSLSGLVKEITTSIKREAEAAARRAFAEDVARREGWK